MNDNRQMILSELEKARNRLLDMTMRNRLLNFIPTKRSTVQILKESPKEVFAKLVNGQQAMTFKGLKDLETEDVDDGDDEELIKTVDDYVPTEKELTDKYLQTDLSPKELDRRLLFIKQKSDSVQEERGYTVLYLALGFLEWTETKFEQKHHNAPLILIPVSLSRQSVGRPFNVKWTEEDIATNLSLQFKLDQLGIKIPDFDASDESVSIDQYLLDVKNATKKQPEWSVNDEIHLGFFSFTKFVMYRDLKPGNNGEEEALLTSPLLRHVFTGEKSPTDSDGIDSGSDYESELAIAKISAKDQMQVMDADSSQIAVIEAAKNGVNLVVEGPPGTGKSQTITNIISELLGLGKKVLFVSEKMAALEVVKNRLEKCGLGDSCLELHSHHANKRALLEDLTKSLQKSPPANLNEEQTIEKRDKLVNDLDLYARTLWEKVGATGRTPYSLIGQYIRARRLLEVNDKKLSTFNINDVEKMLTVDLAEVRELVGDLVTIIPKVGRIMSNPWQFTNPKQLILEIDTDKISSWLFESILLCSELVPLVQTLQNLAGTIEPRNINDIDNIVVAAGVVQDGVPTLKSVLLNEDWNESNPRAESLIATVSNLQSEKQFVDKTFIRNAADSSVETLLRDLTDENDKWYKLLLPDFWRLTKEAKSLHKDKVGGDGLVENLTRLDKYQHSLNELNGREDEAVRLFGSLWKGSQSDTSKLRSFMEWVVRFRKNIIDGFLSENAIEIASASTKTQEINETIAKIESLTKKIRELFASLDKELGFEENGNEFDPLAVFSLNELSDWLVESKENIILLPGWSQYALREDKLRKSFASSLVQRIREESINQDELILTLDASVAEALLRVAMTNYPALRDFVADIHEKRIADFASIDMKLQTLNRQRLARKLYNERPTYHSLEGVPKSESGILLGQLNRKRGHMPIRKLMGVTGSLIQQIKPCFMMSPISVAQFLAPGTIVFDTIIFDEASQVRPEDALGALLRGQQLIVMGDTKQLPPTSFFDNIDNLESEDEDDILEDGTSITDVESILHQCQQRNFSGKTLRWHYRSRHESLIAVSNDQFYDNRLLIYPSISANVPGVGLEFRSSTGSVYDRGKSAKNKLEARLIVEEAVKHYRNSPDESLGIGTFSMKQQQAILDEIEIAMKENPDIQDYFTNTNDEYCFVKNLETIQGDERDVIFVSMGYGKDAAGKLSLNFGPLNREGGHRRLNVLMTRARKRCVLFSNFGAEDLQLDANSPFGLRSLKKFLDYAKNRNPFEVIETGEDTDSPFEDSVKDFLMSQGYEVRSQVGCAEYRIDLAIVNPEFPGRYLIAIECDGQKYHTSPVARDRDRLRQQVLENMGWRNRIHRIWSTDWFHNYTVASQKLIDAIETAKRLPDDNYSESSSTGSGGTIAEDPIVRMKGKTKSDSEDKSETYRMCTRIHTRITPEIYDTRAEDLARAIQEIVDVESPIHVDEVVRRIREFKGLGRAGNRIREAIQTGTKAALRLGLIKKRGNFLWTPGLEKPIVRFRDGDAKVDAEMICDEEVEEAIIAILKNHFATEQDDLIRYSARLLGFSSVQQGTASRFRKVVTALKSRNEVITNPNGMLELNSAINT